MVMWPNENFSIRIGASFRIIRLPQMNAEGVRVQVRRVVSGGIPWAHVEEQPACVRNWGPADHLSTSQTVMISTSTRTTKTIVQTCQLAGRSERTAFSLGHSVSPHAMVACLPSRAIDWWTRANTMASRNTCEPRSVAKSDGGREPC
jgi:hypothetical protein